MGKLGLLGWEVESGKSMSDHLLCWRCWCCRSLGGGLYAKLGLGARILGKSLAETRRLARQLRP